MITNVRLRGWKSHLDTELSFSRGVNALVGIMGSGKSSVTDAIAFGLFGMFPNLQTRKVILDQLIMRQPQEKDTASIEVEFIANKKHYTVRRDIRRGRGSTAEIREDGTLREVSSKQVTQEVERVLGMDYDTFSKAVYSEQNGIDYFLKIPAGRRREHIDRILHVDRFELVRTEARSMQGRISAYVEEQARLAAELEKERPEERRRDIAREEGELRERAAELEKRQKEQEQERKRIEENLRACERRDAERRQTERLLAGLGGGLEEIREREGKARKIVRGRDLGKIDADIAMAEALSRERKNMLERLKEELHAAETTKRLRVEHAKQIEHIGERCPLCDSAVPAEKKHQLIEERLTAVNELNSVIEKTHAAINGREREIRIIEKTLEQKRIEREMISQAFQDIRELERKLIEILSSRKRYEERLASLGEAVETDSLRKDMQDAVSRERVTAAEARAARERAADKAALVQELDKKLALLKQCRDGIELNRRIASKLMRFEQAIRLTQEGLRKEFISTVNSTMEHIWTELYPYGDFSSAQLDVHEGNYVLQLKGREWTDVDAVSGGERSMACLALRIAFSMAFIPNLKWLILDEPTHNLDANAIRAFADALRERLPSLAEQIFLITHDTLLSEGLRHVHLLERNKNAGEATVVKSV